MIQGLNDLAVLRKANPEPLAAIVIEITKLDTAGTKSDEIRYRGYTSEYWRKTH